MSKQILEKTLVEARDNGRSGQVHVIGLHAGTTQGATLMLKDGDIAEARCMGQSGQGALKALLTLDIRYVHFLPNSEKAGASGSRPVVTEFLTRLSKKPRDTANLTQDVQQILESLYGNKAGKMIREVAEAYPPSENPTAFIAQCRALVEAMLGDAKAAELFGSISRHTGE